MSETPESANRPSLAERLIFAIPAALIYGVILYFVVWFPDERPNGSSLPFVGGLVFFPIAITSVVTILADPRGEGSLWRQIKIGWICITLFIVLSIVILKEGGICIAMAAPFFYAGSALGAFISSLSLRKFRSRSIISCLVILPLAGLPAEPLIPAPTDESQVQTVITINAPVQTVWKNTVQIPDIAPQELKWTFSHNIVGVPKLVDADWRGKALALSGICGGRAV